MKKLILFMLLIPIFAFGQSNIIDVNNSTTTALDSGDVFTGTATRLVDYGGERGLTSAISVSVYSDQNSTTNGLRVQFSHDNVDTLWRDSYSGTITGASGSPTVLWFYPEDAYYRVKYTNGTSDQDTLWITSKLYMGSIFPKMAINDSVGVLIGAVDSVHQNLVELLDSLETIEDSISAGNAQLNLIKSAVVASKTALELLDNAVDGNYLNTNMNIAGTDVAANSGANSAQTQRVTIATDDEVNDDVDAIKTAVEIMDDWDDGSDRAQVDIAAQTLGEVLIAGGATQTNDVKVTLDSESVTVGATTGNSTLGHVTVTINATTQLADHACKVVTITNNTSGEILYIGTSGVDAADGFPLGYEDSITLTVSNTNIVYVDSDGSNVEVRYIYEN